MSHARCLAILLLCGCSIAAPGAGPERPEIQEASGPEVQPFIVLRSCSPLPGQAAQSACEHLSEANAAYERGDIEAALEGWGEIIASNDHGLAWYAAVTNCGEALFTSTRYADAIPVLKLLIENDAAVRETYSKEHIGQGFGGRAAESELDSYLFMHAPDWHRACLRLSDCHEILGDRKSALHYAVLSREACRSPSSCGVPWATMQMATSDRIEELEKAINDRSVSR